MCMRKPDNFDSDSNFDYLERLINGELTEEDKLEFINHYLWMIFDKSPSVSRFLQIFRKCLRKSLDNTSDANKRSTDIRTLVKLVLFSTRIEEFNKVHLKPEELKNTFSDEDYKCYGSTNLGEVYLYINEQLDPSKPWVSSLKKNAPRFTFILCTDAEPNDALAQRENARKVLEDNPLKDLIDLWVIYIGHESNRAAAVAIAGGREDRVITLDDDMIEMLTPVIINSTVNLADGSHMDSARKPSLTETAKEAKERKDEGTRSAQGLIDKKLEEEFRRLMGLT